MSEIAKLKRELEVKSKKHDELRGHYRQLQQRHEELERKLKQKEATILAKGYNYAETAAALEKQVNSAMQRAAQLEEENDRARSMNGALQRRVDVAEAMVDIHSLSPDDKNLAMVRVELKAATSELANVRNDLDVERERHVELQKVDAMRQETLRAQEEAIQELQRMCEESREDVALYEREREEMLPRLGKHEDEMRSLQGEWRKAMDMAEESTKACQTLEMQNAELKERTTELEEGSDQHRVCWKFAESERAKLEQELDAVQERFNHVESEYETVRKELLAKREDMTTLEAANEELRSGHSEAVKELDHMRVRLREAEAVLPKLEAAVAEVSTAERVIETLTNERNNLEQELDATRATFGDTQVALTVTKGDLEQLQQDFQTLQTSMGQRVDQLERDCAEYREHLHVAKESLKATKKELQKTQMLLEQHRKVTLATAKTGVSAATIAHTGPRTHADGTSGRPLSPPPADYDPESGGVPRTGPYQQSLSLSQQQQLLYKKAKEEAERLMHARLVAAASQVQSSGREIDAAPAPGGPGRATRRTPPSDATPTGSHRFDEGKGGETHTPLGSTPAGGKAGFGLDDIVNMSDRTLERRVRLTE